MKMLKTKIKISANDTLETIISNENVILLEQKNCFGDLVVANDYGYIFYISHKKIGNEELNIKGMQDKELCKIMNSSYIWNF